jgi:hypothetical protein
MQGQSVTDFTTVDQTEDPESFSRFLHLANLGADVFALKALVGEAGHVFGVDFSETLIRKWWADLATAQSESRFLYGFTAMTVAGTGGS